MMRKVADPGPDPGDCGAIATQAKSRSKPAGGPPDLIRRNPFDVAHPLRDGFQPLALAIHVCRVSLKLLEKVR